jgi:hypothetical protein
MSTMRTAPNQAAAPRGQRSGLPWDDHVWVGDGTGFLDQVPKFEAWRGRLVDGVHVFIGRALFPRWSSITSNGVLAAGGPVDLVYRTSPYKVLMALPLLATESASQFAALANGEFDPHHATVAGQLAAFVGQKPIDLRLGWETTRYGAYPWGIEVSDGAGGWTVPAETRQNYVPGFRRIAAIYKQALPGASVIQNHLNDPRSFAVRDFFPGNDVCDAITVDLYDRGSPDPFVVDEASWATYAGSYDRATGRATGAQGYLDYATDMGVLFGADEWGPTNAPTVATNGANNPFFVRKMREWLAANGPRVMCAGLFNGVDTHQVWPRVDYLATASDAYLEAWGGEPDQDARTRKP